MTRCVARSGHLKVSPWCPDLLGAERSRMQWETNPRGWLSGFLTECLYPDSAGAQTFRVAPPYRSPDSRVKVPPWPPRMRRPRTRRASSASWLPSYSGTTSASVSASVQRATRVAS